MRKYLSESLQNELLTLARKRRIPNQKRIHEASRYIRTTETKIHSSSDFIVRIDPITTRISPDGTGEIYMPSQNIFEHLRPSSPPQGIVFHDGSFLTFKEIFRYDYPSADAPEPIILRTEYSFHYQSPPRHFFFRYDFHPQLGDPLTHLLHHLHAGGWLTETDSLPSIPRFPAAEMTLGEVLDLIRVNYF